MIPQMLVLLRAFFSDASISRIEIDANAKYVF